MDSQILALAKEDIPLYFRDFKNFWDSTTAEFLEADLIDCYANSLIFKNWKISLNHIKIASLNGIINELHEDINASFFHAYFGHYRSAHMHLRSVIELSLQLMYFFQHEIEYGQWELGEFRIKHEELTNYLKKHPALNDGSTINLIDSITKDWKTFSKYIHAEAPVYFQTNNQSAKTKKIVKKDFGVWKSNYLNTGYRINKLLLLFFRSYIHSFPTKNKELLIRNMRASDIQLLEKKSQ